MAVLAVAANLLIQRDISVTRTTRTMRMDGPSSPIAAGAAAVSTSAPTHIVEPPNAKSLVFAIEQYEGAVRSYLDIHNADSDRRLASAAKDLQRETDAFFLNLRDSKETADLGKLRLLLLDYPARGNELMRAADARQTVLKEFRERFDALDARTKSSLAQSWKIFGRVIARKSLVDLNSNLDDIRRGFARIPNTELYDQGTLDSIKASENALSTSLGANALILTRSQGRQWLEQMSTDIRRVGALQDSLIRLDIERRASEQRFAKQSQTLMGYAAGIHSPAGARSSEAGAPRLFISSQALQGSAANLVHLEPIRERVSETTSIRNEKPASIALILWISVGVLSLLLWISIRTVMSVVGPVRRMRAATLKLAGGDAETHVVGGGIRELDDLANSFNRMAQQLAEAQASAHYYQQRLEAKIDLRTRELQHLAEHDPLTDLPNRRQLFTHLKALIMHAAVSGSCVGVYFVDLDNFKNINDSMGHAFGDRVLGAIAERLRSRAGPRGFAARLGGDEFTIVHEDVKNGEGLSALGSDLVRAFEQPVAVDGRFLMISISVGASIYPDHGRDAESLLRAADAALFQAKALGRSQLSVFSAALLESASAKFSTEQGLRYALERGEFELVFQPEVNATTLDTRLVEALLRWRLPDGRYAAPAEFLSIAEESGLIMQISDWVLRTAIETAARWHHGAWPEVRVAVNLSSRQLLDTRFVEHIVALLQQHQLPARCIEIELTENVLQTGASTLEVLFQLRKHGIAIALDDFGTGYSSLASLEQLPLTRVKLDRVLIAGIHVNPRSAAITRALIGLCHSLGLEVTAEGIEHPEQLALLVDLAPIFLQGYLLARPVSADKLLPVMAAMTNHMTSLILSAKSATDGKCFETEELEVDLQAAER